MKSNRIRRTVVGGVLGVVWLVGSMAAGPQRAEAFELSHFTTLPGLINPTDLFLPPPELGQVFYVQYNAYYGTDTFRNSHGDSVDQISFTGRLGQTRTIDLDLDVDVWTVAPLLLYAPDREILGARYGTALLVPFGNPSVGATLTTKAGFGGSIDESSTDIGDLYFQPLTLQWGVSRGGMPRGDVTFAYGFYAPTGAYEAGAADNVGLGFWGHQLQTAGRWSFDEDRTFSAFGALTGEINHNKQDVDVVPGAHLTFNWGVRKELLEQYVELAVIGYSTWQISDDSGADAPSPSKRVRDQVHAAGVQVGIPGFGLAMKYLYEYGAEDRFEGQTVTLSFALPLDRVAELVRGAG